MTIEALARLMEAEVWCPCRYSSALVPRWKQVANRIKACVPDDRPEHVSFHRVIDAACEAYVEES